MLADSRRSTVRLRKLAYLVMCDSGQVFLEHFLLWRHPPHAPVDVMNVNPLRLTNPESITVS